MFLDILDPLNVFEKTMLNKTLKYFNENRQRSEDLASVLTRKNKISLRIADHLVVQYSRDNDILVANEYGGPPCSLWSVYRRLSNTSTKKYFDIFKRKDVIRARLFDDEFVTTVGQLQFMAWFSKQNLIEYMNENEQEIRTHMKKTEAIAKLKAKRKLENVDEDGVPIKMAKKQKTLAKPLSAAIFHGNYKIRL